MAKSPVFYGVSCGRVAGVYDRWSDCEAQVKGYPGAIYKKFNSREEADAFVNDKSADNKSDDNKSDIMQQAREHLDWLYSNNFINNSIYTEISKTIDASKNNRLQINDKDTISVYVDGSFNPDTNEYGYAAYITDSNNKNNHILYGCDLQISDGRNIEGEVAASKLALSYIHDNCDIDHNKIVVYHDYMGIGSWADKDWKANKPYTKTYADFVDKLRSDNMNIEFKHVDGHTGVVGNEYVDRLAKFGCNISLSQSDIDLLMDISDVSGFPEELTNPDAVSKSIESQLQDMGVSY